MASNKYSAYTILNNKNLFADAILNGFHGMIDINKIGKSFVPSNLPKEVTETSANTWAMIAEPKNRK